MRKPLLISVLLAASVTTAADRGAQLECPGSSFSESGSLATYDYRVNQALLNGLAYDPYVRMISLPSFFSEWVVQVDTPSNGSAVVQLVETTRPAWYGGKPKRVKARTRVSRIRASTATALRVAWLAMIDRTTCSEHLRGFDGADYVFQAWKDGFGMAEGMIWSPPDGTRGDALVKLAVELRWLIEGHTPEVTEGDLVRAAQEIGVQEEEH